MDYVLYVLIVIIGLFGILYYGGFLASKGWHLAKRDHIRQVMKDCEEEKDHE